MKLSDLFELSKFRWKIRKIENCKTINSRILHFAADEHFTRLELARFIVENSLHLSGNGIQEVYFKDLGLSENRAIDTRLDNTLFMNDINLSHTDFLLLAYSILINKY